MNHCARLIAGCFLTVAVAGCTQASSSTPSTPTVTVTVTQSPPSQVPLTSHGPTSAAATSAAPQTEVGVCVTPVVTCQGELKTEPSQIILSGDGTAFVTNLLWTGWGSNGATGSGTLKLDNCNPNCARGSLTDYQATVVLSHLTGYVGGAAYATMMVAAPGSPFGTRTYKHLAP
jgi:hypothetical protein